MATDGAIQMDASSGGADSSAAPERCPFDSRSQEESLSDGSPAVGSSRGTVEQARRVITQDSTGARDPTGAHNPTGNGDPPADSPASTTPSSSSESISHVGSSPAMAESPSSSTDTVGDHVQDGLLTRCGSLSQPLSSQPLTKGLAVHFAHESWDLVINIMMGIRMSVGRATVDLPRPLVAKDYRMKEKMTIVPHLQTDSGKSNNVRDAGSGTQ